MKTGGTRINYLPQDPIFSIDKSLLEIVMEKTCKDYPILEYQAKSILSKMGFNDYNITTKNMRVLSVISWYFNNESNWLVFLLSIARILARSSLEAKGFVR